MRIKTERRVLPGQSDLEDAVFPVGSADGPVRKENGGQKKQSEEKFFHLKYFLVKHEMAPGAVEIPDGGVSAHQYRFSPTAAYV